MTFVVTNGNPLFLFSLTGMCAILELIQHHHPSYHRQPDSKGDLSFLLVENRQFQVCTARFRRTKISETARPFDSRERAVFHDDGPKVPHRNTCASRHLFRVRGSVDSIARVVERGVAPVARSLASR